MSIWRTRMMMNYCTLGLPILGQTTFGSISGVISETWHLVLMHHTPTHKRRANLSPCFFWNILLSSTNWDFKSHLYSISIYHHNSSYIMIDHIVSHWWIPRLPASGNVTLTCGPRGPWHGPRMVEVTREQLYSDVRVCCSKRPMAPTRMISENSCFVFWCLSINQTTFLRFNPTIWNHLNLHGDVDYSVCVYIWFQQHSGGLNGEIMIHQCSSPILYFFPRFSDKTDVHLGEGTGSLKLHFFARERLSEGFF